MAWTLKFVESFSTTARADTREAQIRTFLTNQGLIGAATIYRGVDDLGSPWVVAVLLVGQDMTAAYNAAPAAAQRLRGRVSLYEMVPVNDPRDPGAASAVLRAEK